MARRKHTCVKLKLCGKVTPKSSKFTFAGDISGLGYHFCPDILARDVLVTTPGDHPDLKSLDPPRKNKAKPGKKIQEKEIIKTPS